jgi:hypothetical protein
MTPIYYTGTGKPHPGGRRRVKAKGTHAKEHTMRASQLLVPAGLLGGLLVVGPAVERAAARDDQAAESTTKFQWDDLGKALDDAALGRRGRPQEPVRSDTRDGGTRILDDLSRFAREMERAARQVDDYDLEDRLEDLGIDVDDLDIDMDDLEDHLEDLEEALEELADFAAELDERLEIRVEDGQVIVIERRRRGR